MASVEERQAFHEKVQAVFGSLRGEPGKRWARPEEPILHTVSLESGLPALQPVLT
jgi:hypothetical protein